MKPSMSFIWNIFWLPITALFLFFMLKDVWDYRNVLRKPFYPLASAILILSQFIAVFILVYGLLTELTMTLFWLNWLFFLFGGFAWIGVVEPYLERMQPRKRKFTTDASQPDKPLVPDTPYVIGDDGEIVKIGDEKKGKSGGKTRKKR